MSLSKSDKINLSTTEIAKRIRKQLKQEFKNCKFSVTRQYYSMGSSIHVCLMIADRQIKKKFCEISETALLSSEGRYYDGERVKKLQEQDYHQLNPYTLREAFKPDYWCNGVFLTADGHKLLKRVVRIADHYNFDDSDNFAFNLNLGKWNKAFIDGESDNKREK